MVLKMVVNYARQHSGQNALRTMVGPLIERVSSKIILISSRINPNNLYNLNPFVVQVLNDKNLSIETNPIDIYKSWRNQIEMETGRSS